MMRATTIVLLLVLTQITSRADGLKLGQMCWSYGIADNRVYYAENYVSSDSSESFDALMEFTGIYRRPTVCMIEEPDYFETKRDYLLRDWATAGLQAVNTTFLSDLDY